MAKDSGNCGCGSDSNKNNKDKEACPESRAEKKSGFSQSPCKSSKGKGKCHESHEDFKKKSNDCGKSKGDKCGSGESRGSACGGSSKDECSDSYKKFQESIQDECSNSQPEVSVQEQMCKESRPKSVPCSAQAKPDPCPCANNSTQETKRDCQSNIRSGPCSSSMDLIPKKESPCSSKRGRPEVGSCQSNIRSGPCSSSMNLVSEKKESPCSSKRGRSEDGSLYSKITNRCKNMAKDFVKPKSNSKCSGVDESLQGNSMCNQPAPPASLPCPPKTEKGVGYGPPCCTSRVTCSESKASSWADFFPLDARNKKLNACIEKYSKLDPGKVVSQCSQFVNRAKDTSERCTEQARKVQQQCLQGVKSTPAAVKRAALLSTRHRTLISRYAPSAGLYLATSALITLYLTEWKVVPGFYTDAADKEP